MFRGSGASPKSKVRCGASPAGDVFDRLRANEALSGSAVLGRVGDAGRDVDERGNVGVRPALAGMFEKRERSDATGGIVLVAPCSSSACSDFSVTV